MKSSSHVMAEQPRPTQDNSGSEKHLRSHENRLRPEGDIEQRITRADLYQSVPTTHSGSGHFLHPDISRCVMRPGGS